TTSGCFYPRSNHWEVGGRPQCVTSVAAEFELLTVSFSMTLETISNYRNSYPGFSSGRPYEPHPQMTGTLSYRPEETGGRQRRNRRTHDTGDGTTDIAFYRGQRLHGGGLFARRPVRCVPLTPAHRRRRSLWCREHRNWRDNEWGRVLFTDEQIQFE
ncbi:transposable element Tcb1 transposase, partial [Trichonephila clavipes]